MSYKMNTAEQFPVAESGIDGLYQDPNPNLVPVAVTEPKAKGKKSKVTKSDPAPEVPAIIEEATVTTEVPAEPITEEPITEVVVEVPTDTTELQKFQAMSTDEIWAHFGGYESRGSISRAIRGLDAAGMPRSEIATKLNKRYQHVRNVLTEPLAAPKK